MATLILTAVGTALGGPLGGAIGAFVGRQADNAVFGGGSAEGARLRELSVTTSSYGQPISRVFGRMRVAGSVIWSTELIESSTKEGGGKGRPSTTTYSYSASFAVALSSTPLSGIGRIWADGSLLRGASGDLKVGGVMRSYLGTGDSPVDPIIFADKGTTAPAFRDFAYVVFEDLQLGEFGNRIPALTFETFATKSGSVSLDDLVPSSVVGNTEPLLPNANGFSDEGGAVRSSLSAIDGVYPLVCKSTATGLNVYAEQVGNNQFYELPDQLSARGAQEAEQRFKRRGQAANKEPLALRYYDEERDYQPGIQRALGRRRKGIERTVDLPAAMTADGAKKLATENAQRARWHDEEVRWTIGELDPSIGPGSIVRIPNATGVWSITSWEWFDRGIELNLRRLAPSFEATLASDSGAANQPNDELIAPTLLDVFELPPDSASNLTSPLVFAATSAISGGWKGASLFVEQGGTLVSIGVSKKDRSIVGQTRSVLPPSNAAIIESGASLDIEVAAEDLALSSTDLVGLSAGENRLLLGGEILQFCEATQINSTHWRLDGLLRGRAGTESEASISHPVGTPFVVLDEKLTPLDHTLVPSSGATRVAAIGLGDKEPVFVNLANPGLSLRPMIPVWPRVVNANADSKVYCWTRRARGQWLWTEANEVPLIEEKEQYQVGYGPVDAPFVSWSTSEPRFTLSNDDAQSLLSEYGSETLWVRQLGTHGQSQALALTALN